MKNKQTLCTYIYSCVCIYLFSFFFFSLAHLHNIFVDDNKTHVCFPFIFPNPRRDETRRGRSEIVFEVFEILLTKLQSLIKFNMRTQMWSSELKRVSFEYFIQFSLIRLAEAAQQFNSHVSSIHFTFFLSSQSFVN